MAYNLVFTPRAETDLAGLNRNAEKLKKVNKTLGLLETQGPAYPGLNSHKYSSMAGKNGEEVWESYVENNCPAAFRIFWHYGPPNPPRDPNSSDPPPLENLTIVAITPHP
jgi:hypothetical protein